MVNRAGLLLLASLPPWFGFDVWMGFDPGCVESIEPTRERGCLGRYWAIGCLAELVRGVVLALWIKSRWQRWRPDGQWIRCEVAFSSWSASGHKLERL